MSSLSSLTSVLLLYPASFLLIHVIPPCLVHLPLVYSVIRFHAISLFTRQVFPWFLSLFLNLPLNFDIFPLFILTCSRISLCLVSPITWFTLCLFTFNIWFPSCLFFYITCFIPYLYDSTAWFIPHLFFHTTSFIPYLIFRSTLFTPYFFFPHLLLHLSFSYFILLDSPFTHSSLLELLLTISSSMPLDLFFFQHYSITYLFLLILFFNSFISYIS